MRAVLIAIAVTLFATQTFAQGGKSRPTGDTGSAPKGEDVQKRRAAEDAAAKAAMSKIPDSKEKYDPWKIGR
jgi:hypothetical protein